MLTACDKPTPSPTATTPSSASGPIHTDSDDVYQMQAKVQPNFKKMQDLGKKIFFDPSLSASGQMSCASCHDPKFAYGPPNRLSTQYGGQDMTQMGMRAVPSLRYQQNVPPFTEHHFDEDINDSIDQGAVGGHDWDGRTATTHGQSAQPLLAASEMANLTPQNVAKKLRATTYSADFRDTFGADALDDDGKAFKWATLALEIFQQDPQQFYPYNSKYDAYLRHQAQLSPAEARGLAAFNDPAKGNCASCHTSRIGNTGAFPAFSDFGILAIGVPRNSHLTVNQDLNFYDLGACGPLRTDLKDKTQYCGAFRTPSLRNVALRQVFFHNGQFHDLKTVLAFYATRDTHPERWYSKDAQGHVQKFDDLPPQYHGNVNAEAPFNRKPGDKPVLTDAEIRDMIAFMHTLTDADQLRNSH